MTALKKISGNRGTLFSMGTCYAMGTFNDNFFKQAALLLASSAGIGVVQGVATMLFALPFVACSAWAGWLADRRPKSSLVIWSKFVEVVAMLIGVWTLFTMDWVGMILVVFFMGLQSTFFSPALNGAIPEIFSAATVPRVNAYLKLATTATILLGIAAGGMLLDTPAFFSATWLPEGKYAMGRMVVGITAVFVSVIGVATAFGIRKSHPVPHSDAPFPWLGPVDSVRHAFMCRKEDRLLFLTLMGEAFFYTVSSFVLLCINNLGVRQLGFSVTATSLLSVSLMLGVCFGSVVAGRHEAAVWRRFMLPAGVGMLVGVIVSSGIAWFPASWDMFPAGLVFLVLAYGFTGICAGMYLIPLVSFIQVRPAATAKGKVLGISNFASFSGVIFAGFVFMMCDGLLMEAGAVLPSTLLVFAGVLGLVFMFWVSRQLILLFPFERYSFLGMLLRLLLALRYRVTTSGLNTLEVKGPVLFLPNHPGLIDPFIVYSQLAGYSPRPLVDEKRMGGWYGRVVAWLLNAVLIPDVMKDGEGAVAGTRNSIHVISDALRKGGHVLMYPSGRIYRSSHERIGGNSGAFLLVRQMPDLQVVLVRSTGLWGSSFTYGATGKEPSFGRSVFRGMFEVIGNFFFFMPRRRVHIDFVVAEDLATITDKKVFNRRLEDFYNVTERPAMEVPRWFWQGSREKVLPEYVVREDVHDASGISGEVRDGVYRIFREIAMLPEDFSFDDDMRLADDLGFDSLMLMDLSLGIEDVFGKSVSSLALLNTVSDCLLLATGQLEDTEDRVSVPDAWFVKPVVKDVSLPTGIRTIVDAFFWQLRRHPGELLLAERNGLRHRREIFIGALVMAERFKRLPGPRLGILMPSVPAVVVVWLGAMLAGKVPVFFNWSVGEVNLRHCIGLTEVAHIVSVSPLMERMERQGMAIADLGVEWLPMDKLALTFSRRDKLRGLLKSFFLADSTYFSVPETAAVLFTSGSESFPKAVPLTHRNLLSNVFDVIAVLNLSMDDTVLAMLPPFHSFGLIVGLVIPLSTGIKAVFHANPTEPAQLNGLVHDFRVSLLAAPPTFLNAMLEQAKGTTKLASVKYAFAGAEKCPAHVYRVFAELCPDASLCEGYGITECSPVVSVNRPGDVVPGTIGPLLPSVIAAVVREEEGIITGRVPEGEPGMLLVRGPSVFNGYIGDAPSPFVEFEGETWYRTGDIISMDKKGRLTFVGRLKRFVKVGGEMISLPQIEEVLLEAFSSDADLSDEGVLLAVEATPEEAGAEIVLFTRIPLTLAEVNAKLKAAGLSLLYSVKRIEKMENIPLLGSGKTDYRALKEWLSLR